MKHYPLDLRGLPPVLYLFGLTGVGKNWVADLLGRLSGRTVYHADSDMPEEMLEAIKAGRSFTPDQRSAYFQVVTSRIIELKTAHAEIIVTQATYKEEHRKLLTQKIPGIGILHIAAPDDLILARLMQRGDSISPDYAAKIRRNFEAPDGRYPVLHNDQGEDRVITQILALYPPPRRPDS